MKILLEFRINEEDITKFKKAIDKLNISKKDIGIRKQRWETTSSLINKKIYKEKIIAKLRRINRRIKMSSLFKKVRIKPQSYRTYSRYICELVVENKITVQKKTDGHSICNYLEIKK